MLPPVVWPLPSMENVSLFRVESKVERGIRTTLGLATPEDHEPEVSAQLPPQASSSGPENLVQ